MLWVIPFMVAVVDRLYWAVFGKILQVLPDRHGGGPWGRQLLESIISGVGGVAGAYAIGRLTGQSDLVTGVIGAFIGGRVVGTVVAIVGPPYRQSA